MESREKKVQMTVISLFVVFFLFVSANVIAQEDDFDEEHIESSLSNFSAFNTNLEFYQFRPHEHAFYFLTNGKIEFGNSDYLNFELIGARYVKDGTIGFTLGDFNCSYTKNLYSRNYLRPGFQGLSPGIKLIVPTGNHDYSGLFGHWIVEPAVYYSWLLNDEKFFVSNRWRLFLPFANAKETNEPPRFIRFEPRFGYENKKIWISITIDNRYLYNQDEFVLYTRGDVGYKLNERSGISVFYTKRMYNTVLFDTYSSIGYYYIF